MTRRSYSGAAVPVTLTSPLTAIDSSAATTALVDWPDYTTGPFIIVIDRDLATEEKILCSEWSTNTITFSQRGFDGTHAADHSTNAVVEHCISALDMDEANDHVNSTAGVHGVSGNLVGTTATQTLTNKTIDGISNTLTNVPLSGSPEISSAITAVANDLSTEVTNRTTAVSDEASARTTADGLRYTKTESDARYVKLAGDTMTGALVLPGDPSTALQAATKGYADMLTPVGVIQMFGGAVAPTGWLLCDGSTKSPAAYPALFAVIGTTFGGNGTTTFILPDLRGRQPIGVSSGHALGTTGGSETSVIGSANLPVHTHDINHNHPSATTSSDSHTHTINTYTGATGTTTGRAAEVTGGSGSTITTNATAHTHTVDLPALGTTASGNGGFANNALDTLDPYLTLSFIIKA